MAEGAHGMFREPGGSRLCSVACTHLVCGCEQLEEEAMVPEDAD